MRILLYAIALLILAVCSMHPPSSTAFMEALEQSYDGKNTSSYSVKVQHIKYSHSADEWDLPVGFEKSTAVSPGYVVGWGLLPSPYFHAGGGNKYIAIKGWVSTIWLAAFTALYADDEDNSSEATESYSDDEETLDELTLFVFELFSGGFSFIQQLPIGDHLRIGVEEYISRNFWIAHLTQEDFSNVECGIGPYISFRTRQHRFAVESHFGLIDFSDKKRWTIGLTYTYTK